MGYLNTLWCLILAEHGLCYYNYVGPQRVEDVGAVQPVYVFEDKYNQAGRACVDKSCLPSITTSFLLSPLPTVGS